MGLLVIDGVFVESKLRGNRDLVNRFRSRRNVTIRIRRYGGMRNVRAMTLLETTCSNRYLVQRI
jgi:hypothetical protein